LGLQYIIAPNGWKYMMFQDYKSTFINNILMKSNNRSKEHDE